MKVAFTTSDNVHINAHFGSAKTLAVYDVNTEGYNLVENIDFSGDLKQDGNEDKLAAKIEALADCTIVYVGEIGGSAAARLINKTKVTPVKASSKEDKITSVLEQLVTTLKGSPPPWLRKALQQEEANKNRFSDFEDEEEE